MNKLLIQTVKWVSACNDTDDECCIFFKNTRISISSQGIQLAFALIFFVKILLSLMLLKSHGSCDSISHFIIFLMVPFALLFFFKVIISLIQTILVVFRSLWWTSSELAAKCASTYGACFQDAASAFSTTGICISTPTFTKSWPEVIRSPCSTSHE